MSRYNSQSSYGHKIQYLKHWDIYRISWIVDRHYSGSRLRYPTTYSRDTDEMGAKRFCQKWGLEMPAD